MTTTALSLLAEVPDLADHEALSLLRAATGLASFGLLGDPPVDDDVAAHFRTLVTRRRHGEPLQYIEGTVQFGPLELNIDARALVPRPETERLWEITAAKVRSVDRPVIVDLCTGSGNLALAYRHDFPGSVVVGVDLSPPAIALAKENAAKTGLDVRFVQGDLFGGLPTWLRGKVDLLVSNPPYIGRDEVAALPAEVRDHEPRAALVAGSDGTEILARIAAGAADWVRPGGVIACEIGETQGDDCLRLFSAFDPEVQNDLADRPRYVIGSAPQRPNVH
jgi:release factor glutamine methyltransferase